MNDPNDIDRSFDKVFESMKKFEDKLATRASGSFMLGCLAVAFFSIIILVLVGMTWLN